MKLHWMVTKTALIILSAIFAVVKNSCYLNCLILFHLNHWMLHWSFLERFESFTLLLKGIFKLKMRCTKILVLLYI